MFHRKGLEIHGHLISEIPSFSQEVESWRVRGERGLGEDWEGFEQKKEPPPLEYDFGNQIDPLLPLSVGRVTGGGGGSQCVLYSKSLKEGRWTCFPEYTTNSSPKFPALGRLIFLLLRNMKFLALNKAFHVHHLPDGAGSLPTERVM